MAILLITNSHLDHLYPIFQLGTGGAIGNSLFFMLSGYGLALSWEKEKRKFPQWYKRRILRIYPSLILVVGIFDLFMRGSWKSWTFLDYLTAFTWPTPAWFISALMLFYIVVFIMLKKRNQNAFLFAIFLLFIPYFYMYFTYLDISQYNIEGPGYFKWIFYLQIMLFGCFLAYRSRKIEFKNPYSLICLIVALTLYFVAGINFIKGNYAEYQFTIHLLTFAIAYFIFTASRSLFVLEKIMGNKKLSYMITFVSGLTLEIYLLQYYVYSNVVVTSLFFPINIIVFWILVVSLAFVIFRMADFLRTLLSSNLIKKSITCIR
ncbi:MAG: acyltransferase [Ignavibacterium sp.]|nr:acyltransferase [Ignavibacterium sp.]